MVISRYATLARQSQTPNHGKEATMGKTIKKSGGKPCKGKSCKKGR